MAASPQVRKAIVDSENALRDSLWPDAEQRLWGHKASGGFVTTPKTMPYVCRMLDEMSKDHPLGPTYEALWSYTWGNNAFLRFNKPDDVAYAAGFSGQRGRRTLIDRMRRLQLLGFIEAQPNGNSRLGKSAVDSFRAPRRQTIRQRQIPLWHRDPEQVRRRLQQPTILRLAAHRRLISVAATALRHRQRSGPGPGPG